MPRAIRIIISFTVIFVFLSVLLSPFIALFLPKKLRNHTYAELVYQVIADRESKDCKTSEQKILKLLSYVRNNIVSGGNIYQGKPLDYLIMGTGYCDYQARTLNALLGRLGVLSRYAMLVDKDGLSPHTLNEVFIDGKWVIFDVTFNIEFKQGNRFLDTADLKRNPDLLIAVLDNSSLKEQERLSYKEILLNSLPFDDKWRRSTPRVKQYHIVDYLIGLYKKVFGNIFSSFYQDFYLKLALQEIPSEDEKLFLSARNYHLLYRRQNAINYYEELLKKFPQSKYANDCMRFVVSLN